MNKIDFYTDEINKALAGFMDKESLDMRLREAMEYSLMNAGKRVRPALVLAFCELVSGDCKQAINAACAVEMIHTYSLIHDDLPCMDNDEMRRGKPSNHVVYGDDMALLAGDALLTLAFEAGLSDESATSAKAMKILAGCAGMNGMVGGQCIDLASEGKNVDIAVLEKLDGGKTVALISAACQMGVVMGKGTDEEVSSAQEYAHGLGMAFQICDDILDVVGDKEKLGKPIGSDSENNKSTYVSLLGIDGAQQRAQKYTDQAINSLEGFSGDTEGLKELAMSLLNRDK